MQNQTLTTRLSALVAFMCLIALVVQPYQPVQALPMMFIVTNTNDSGSGSLRWAIGQSNSNSGKDTIVFNIPTSDPNYYTASGYFVIPLLSFLPPLTDLAGVIIDATTQTTYTGDTNPLGPEIAIVAGAFPFTGTFFTLVAGDTSIKGLSLSGDGNGIGIDIFPDSHNNTIMQNYIGIDPRGHQCGGGHSIGIRIYSQNNIISNNVISCSQSDAIQLHSTSSLNHISGNIIGLNAQKNIIGNLPGPDSYGNQGNGINFLSSNTNMITDNYISHNGKSGIAMQDSMWNTIQRNVIGVNDTDSKILGNGEYGILLDDYSADNLIRENYVAGNHKTGIFLTGANTWANQLRKNQIGVNKNNHLIPNGHHGIGIYNGANNNTVGGLYDPEYGNTIYNSSWSGIAVVDSADYNVIGHNHIGNPPGVGVNYHGIAIVNSSNNIIKLNTIAGNGINAEAAGVLVDGITAPAIHNRITQNSIYNNHTMGIKLLNNGNDGILPPVINAVNSGRVQGLAFPGSTVEVFSDAGSQGRYYEGSTTADPIGVWEWLGTPCGPYVTATQTDAYSNTSSFSSPYAFIRIYLPLIVR